MSAFIDILHRYIFNGKSLQLTGRYRAVWLRNFWVWQKLAKTSVLGNIAEPLITLLAFGYGVGQLIGQINGIPYIKYLASGSIVVSVVMAASFEALFSAYTRMKEQKTWENIMNAPVSLDDIVLGEWLWCITKAMITAGSILLVIVILGISRSPTLFWALPILAITAGVFSSFGMVITAKAKSYETFTYYFTLVLTPMTFLSGVYFPQSQLPEMAQWIAQILPLSLAVQLVRPLFLGQPVPTWLPLFGLLLWGLIGFVMAIRLFRARFEQQ